MRRKTQFVVVVESISRLLIVVFEWGLTGACVLCCVCNMAIVC